jgi:amidophosphoribosyltransferase
MDKKEKCGLVGAYSAKGIDVAPTMLQGLEALQHRGQESWGMAVSGNPLLRRMGLVTNWHVDAPEAAALTGKSGIGHVRYSTKGKSVIDNAQPIEIEGEFSIAHNGTLVNADQLAAPVREEFGRSCESDTRAAGYRLLHHLRECGDMLEAFSRLSREIFGAYCFIILDKEGRVYAARDPRGYRPLSLGWDRETETFLAASESCAIEAMGAAFIRDVEPGEIVVLGPKDGTPGTFQFSPKVAPAYCSFEYTYFAHPSSRLNGVSVYEARKRVGRALARAFRTRADVVVPVPDSARPAALGFALESGIPMDEGLMKDRYRRKGSIRSFIEPEQGGREEVVRKIIPVRDAVDGRDVLVVDDSLVRGTSSKVIVQALKKAGAKSVKMAVTFPAIRHPCFMGIDFPDREELLAYRVARGEADPAKTAEEVAKAVGVDEFYYNDVEGLSRAIGLPEDSLCFACVTGDYSKLGFRPPALAEEEVKA